MRERHGLIWSKEINKMFCSQRAKFYPRKKAYAEAGFLGGGEPVWLASIAIKTHDDGYVCPMCGGSEDQSETITTVEYEGYENGRGTMPYIQTDCKCSTCGKWWRIRTKSSTAESVVDFTPARNPLVNIPMGCLH